MYRAKSDCVSAIFAVNNKKKLFNLLKRVLKSNLWQVYRKFVREKCLRGA